jgi:hypothetical protein
MGATNRRQAGYTVIELSLFLGISSLLFMIAIFATGSTIRNARFTDSGRALEAYVQKQYDNIVNGVNPRASEISCAGGVVSSGTQEPGTSNCLLVGKLLLFQIGSYTINTYDIVATDPGINVDFSKTDEQLIAQDYQPKVVSNINNASYDISWQAPITGIKRTSDGVQANALALIRSPRSQRILAYTYQEGATPTDGRLASVVGNASANTGNVVNYCLQSADAIGPMAKLEIGTGSNQSAARIIFDISEEDCHV